MGPYVEEKFGSGKMGIIYLVSGLAGGLATYYFGGSGKASAGASGAIFGLVGALISYFLLNQSSVSNAILPQLFLIVAINMYFGFASQNIGNAAHIGGLIGGLIVGFIFAR
jgi:rhomboid protease GluP